MRCFHAVLAKKNSKEPTKRRKTDCLAGINYIIFLFIGIFFSRSYFSLFGASEAVVEYGAEYLSICCILSFGVFGQITFERILQSVGKTMLTMVTQMIGAVLNIILDPIMIYGLLGFPKMGVAGAALATVIGQIIAFIAGIILNHKFNHEVRLNMRSFRPDGAIIKNIYSVGVPSIIMGSIGSVMTVGINQIVRICGSVADTAQAVFGVYFKLQSFVFMPVFGLNNGMVPIIAYNFGAKKRDRLTKTIKLSVLYACILMLIGFCCSSLCRKRCFAFSIPVTTIWRESSRSAFRRCAESATALYLPVSVL